MDNNDTVVIKTTVEDLKSLVVAYNEDSEDALVALFFNELANVFDTDGHDVGTPIGITVEVDGEQHVFSLDDED